MSVSQSQPSEINCTVYIAAHNMGCFLQEAIESVLRQTVDNWELLIIDDGSSDNTPQIIKIYEGDPRIRVFRTEGVGLPSVCNIAISEARGEFLIRLDGDDILDENALLVLQNTLANDQDLAMAFPDYYLIDETGQVFSHERREPIYSTNHMMDMPPNGACTMVRRQIMLDIGGYREDLGAQDGLDLWLKIKDGYKTTNVNLPLFFYRRHQNNLTNNNDRILAARRAIKRDAMSLLLDNFRPLIALIPCRRNYDFVPDLWKQPLGGKALLDNKIETCLSCDILDYIVVAGDNPETEQAMRRWDDPRLVFHLRDPKNTIRSRSIVPTIEKVVRKLDKDFAGITVLSYISNPFATPETLEESISTLIMNDADCSISVVEIKEPLLKRSNQGLVSINRANGFSSDFSVVYRETKTSLATRNSNIRRGSLTGARTVNFTLSDEEAFFIDSDISLEVARMMAARKS